MDYDPHLRQPATLGELERWMYVSDAWQLAHFAPAPIPLNPPPILGLDTLGAYCRAEYGQPLSVETINRLIGKVALARGVSTEKAREASIESVASMLRPPTVGPVSKRLHVDEIDSFRKVRDVTAGMVAPWLENGYLSRSEEEVQRALEQILGVPFHRKDWAGELNDLFTANVTVSGGRCRRCRSISFALL